MILLLLMQGRYGSTTFELVVAAAATVAVVNSLFFL